jgi:hypothetical protein
MKGFNFLEGHRMFSVQKENKCLNLVIILVLKKKTLKSGQITRGLQDSF